MAKLILIAWNFLFLFSALHHLLQSGSMRSNHPARQCCRTPKLPANEIDGKHHILLRGMGELRCCIYLVVFERHFDYVLSSPTKPYDGRREE